MKLSYKSLKQNSLFRSIKQTLITKIDLERVEGKYCKQLTDVTIMRNDDAPFVRQKKSL